MSAPREPLAGRDVAAIILAVSLGFAVCSITVAVLYDAIASAGPGLSDNATQVLTAAFGGIIGILGTFVGYTARDGQLWSPPRSGAAPPSHSGGAEPPTEGP